jgi:hypothetical protein
MNILRRWPFLDTPSAVDVAGERIVIRAYQIVVWVSLSLDETLPTDMLRLPAILDTGHNHNFSLRADQMTRWAGVHPDQCPKVGAILVNRLEVPLLAANLWIHRNRAGTAELLRKPVRLPIPEGVSVFPSDSASSPRVPLLGLRGLVRNGWRLAIDATWISLSNKSAKRSHAG